MEKVEGMPVSESASTPCYNVQVLERVAPFKISETREKWKAGDIASLTRYGSGLLFSRYLSPAERMSIVADLRKKESTPLPFDSSWLLACRLSESDGNLNQSFSDIATADEKRKPLDLFSPTIDDILCCRYGYVRDLIRFSTVENCERLGRQIAFSLCQNGIFDIILTPSHDAYYYAYLDAVDERLNGMTDSSFLFYLRHNLYALDIVSEFCESDVLEMRAQDYRTMADDYGQIL